MEGVRRKMSNTKLKLLDLNPHLMCVLCGGYYIDATTIVECLHSFCRSCIVKHLESSKYCPICEVQVHKTKPLINIRPDKTLQDIVYKLVPGLFANEMRNRRKFYKERPHYIKPNNSELVGEVSGDRKIYINDENITFSLVYNTGSASCTVGDRYREIPLPAQNEKRYFKCPTGVTVYHLKKLLRTKYELNESNYKMEVYLKDQPLHEDLTLLDISYIYLWKNKGSLDLTFKIFENVVKRQKMDEKLSQNVTSAAAATATTTTTTTNQSGERLRDPSIQPKKESAEVSSQGVSETRKADEDHVGRGPSAAVPPPAATPSVGTVKAVRGPDGPASNSHGVRENGLSPGSEVKEVQLQISESGVMSVSQVEDGELVRTVDDHPGNKGAVSKGPTMTTTTSATTAPAKSQQSGTGVKVEAASGTASVATPSVASRQTAGGDTQPRKPASKPVKQYKTIRYSPKTWHPVIPKEKLRPTLMKNTEEPKKPLKFFKMRNMPRFLGNPASGVKPMYAEPTDHSTEEKKSNSNKKEAATAPVAAAAATAAAPTADKKPDPAKNKILKIDPKTLRPIEKEDLTKVAQTPTVPNLLTNPFIPNNNHFLFSDLHLLPPNCGNFSNAKSPGEKSSPTLAGGVSPSGGTSGGGSGGTSPVSPGFKNPVPNGTYPPICFPAPDPKAGFYPFGNLGKPQAFPFPVGDKMDPLLRASRLSPFGNLAGFNVAGFHASLPPSISRLLNPHHHFRKVNQSSSEKKNKDESTKETKNCDDSIKAGKTATAVTTTTTTTASSASTVTAEETTSGNKRDKRDDAKTKVKEGEEKRKTVDSGCGQKKDSERQTNGSEGRTSKEKTVERQKEVTTTTATTQDMTTTTTSKSDARKEENGERSEKKGAGGEVTTTTTTMTTNANLKESKGDESNKSASDIKEVKSESISEKVTVINKDKER